MASPSDLVVLRLNDEIELRWLLSGQVRFAPAASGLARMLPPPR
jgi:hypothetical protein